MEYEKRIIAIAQLALTRSLISNNAVSIDFLTRLANELDNKINNAKITETNCNSEESAIVSKDCKWSDDEVMRLIRYLCNEDDVYGYADGDDNIFKKLLNSYYSQYISPLRK